MNERIEPYFNQELPPTERVQFERELLDNTQLADEVAFYLRTKAVLREQVLADRHAEWQQLGHKVPRPVAPLRRIQPWYYAAAAIVLLAMVWIWFSIPQPNVQELTASYVENKLTDLSLQMGGDADSLQSALQSYNEGKFATAKAMSEALLQRNPDNAEALKLTGIIALRQNNQGEAIDYFHRLAERKDFANPGKLYEALGYLQRGQRSDLDSAKVLLQAVVSGNLEGRKEAEKWLEALEKE